MSAATRACPICYEQFDAGIASCPEHGVPLVASTARDLVGEVVDGRYEVLEVLGRGAMGVVVRAEHQLLGQEMALKVLSAGQLDGPTAIMRFRKEARAIASLTSPHTIRLHDMGVTPDGIIYYTMDLLRGESLADLLYREGRVEFARASDLVMQACASLSEAHRAGILHRDVKPENIFRTERPGGEHVTVLDFGLAKLVGDVTATVVTNVGSVCGTPAYMSPEQATGSDIDSRTDVYSLGCVLYHLLTGELPFDREKPMDIMVCHVTEPLVPAHERTPDAQIPLELSRAVSRAMAKLPDERFQTVDAFRDALLDATARARRARPGGLMRRADPQRTATVIVGETQAGDSLPRGAVAPHRSVTVARPAARTFHTAIVPVAPTQPPAPADVTLEQGTIPQVEAAPRRWVLPALGMVAALLAIAIVVVLATKNRAGPDPAAPEPVAVSESAVPAPSVVADSHLVSQEAVATPAPRVLRRPEHPAAASRRAVDPATRALAVLASGWSYYQSGRRALADKKYSRAVRELGTARRLLGPDRELNRLLARARAARRPARPVDSDFLGIGKLGR